MKRVFLSALIVLSLFISSCAALAAGETTTALENGHIKLPFVNGYH